MTERTVIRSRTIGDTTYEVARIRFETIREARGFRRPVIVSRLEYRVGGHQIAGDIYRALLATARERND